MTASKNRLVSLANLILKVIGIAIFFVLTRLSLCYTQYMMPGNIEKMVTVRDNVLQNVLVFLICIGVGSVLYYAEEKWKERTKRVITLVVVLFAMFAVGLQCFWWIYSADRIPVGDQAFVYGGASYFLEGCYSFLEKGGYCFIYPHQLGLIALTESLFCLVGTYNYMAFEVICAVLAIGIAGMGYLLLKEICNHFAVNILYCLFITACSPLIFYSSWVYGDLPSIFFMLLAAWALLKLERTRRNGWILLVAVSVTMAILVRVNSIIFLIAALIVGVLCILQHKKYKVVVALFAAGLLSMLSYNAIFKMYEIRSGEEHSEGIPASTSIAMGLQESWTGNGWYNDYPKIIFGEADFDRERTDEIAKEEIRARIEVFKQNPVGAYHFFYQKLASQWDAPLYQSLYFSGSYQPDRMPEQDSLVYKLSHEYYNMVLLAADRLQFLIYAGMLFYFLFIVRADSRILQHVLAVTIIGGFLFSLFWEAKARYIFPYYVLMFPLAAAGYRELPCAVRRMGVKCRERMRHRARSR